MIVAVVGKFGGAYFGAKLTGVRTRQAGALATLMNTRGLTELVILTVGLNLGILSTLLYTLMVVMAIVTTGMAGPLLRYIYPNRIMERDIVEADRSALGQAGAHRIVVLVDDPVTAGPLVDWPPARLGQAEQRGGADPPGHAGETERLEVGSGLGGELLAMTATMDTLQQLAARAEARGVATIVRSRFSDDVAAELPGYVGAADPDKIVMYRDTAPLSELSNDGRVQIVVLVRPCPRNRRPRSRTGSGAPTPMPRCRLPVQLAVAGTWIWCSPRLGGRRRPAASDLTKRGLAATGNRTGRRIVVGPADALLRCRRRRGAGRGRRRIGSNRRSRCRTPIDSDGSAIFT